MGQGIMQRKDEAHCGIRAQPRVSYLRIFSIYPLIATPPCSNEILSKTLAILAIHWARWARQTCQRLAMEVAKQTRSGGGGVLI